MSASSEAEAGAGAHGAAFGNRRELEAALGRSDLVPAFERLREPRSGRSSAPESRIRAWPQFRHRPDPHRIQESYGFAPPEGGA